MFAETQIPSSRQCDWELDRINNNREYLQNGEGTCWILVDGVYRWLSNDNPIPASTFEEAYLEVPEGQAEACRKHLDGFMANYVDYRNKHGYSDEEQSEIANEFGSETVVDVFTGQKINHV